MTPFNQRRTVWKTKCYFYIYFISSWRVEMYKGHFDIPLSVCKTISDTIGYSLSGSACCEVPESSIKKHICLQKQRLYCLHYPGKDVPWICLYPISICLTFDTSQISGILTTYHNFANRCTYLSTLYFCLYWSMSQSVPRAHIVPCCRLVPLFRFDALWTREHCMQRQRRV